MPDVAIVDRAIAAAPKNYKLPAGQEILLRAVKASFDGSGAGSAYYPTLQLVAPDGTVMWSSETDSSVAAGASADVSWFPGVTAAAASSGAVLGTTYGSYTTVTPVSCPAGVVTYAEWDYSFGAHLLDLTDPLHPTVTTTGMYWIGVTFEGSGAWTAGAALQGTLETNVTPAAIYTAYPLADNGGAGPVGFVAMGMYLTSGQEVHVFFINRDSATRHAFLQQADVHLLAT